MTGTIAVDFDGVLHAYSKGWHDGTIYDQPLPGAFEALRQLMREYAVFVHTTRNAGEVALWLAKHGGFTCVHDRRDANAFWNDQTRLLVTDRKLPAIAYIDDRAIHFTSWDQTLAEVRRREDGATP